MKYTETLSKNLKNNDAQISDFSFFLFFFCNYQHILLVTMVARTF